MERTTKITVLIRDGERKTDLLRQLDWILFALGPNVPGIQEWSQVQTRMGTTRRLPTVCSHIRQSRLVARVVRCLVCFISLLTSKLLYQLAMDHGEKQPITTRNGS